MESLPSNLENKYITLKKILLGKGMKDHSSATLLDK